MKEVTPDQQGRIYLPCPRSGYLSVSGGMQPLRPYLKSSVLRPPSVGVGLGLPSGWWLARSALGRPLFVFLFFPLFSFLVRGDHADLGPLWETILAQAIYWRPDLLAVLFGVLAKPTAPSGAKPPTRVIIFGTLLLTIL